MTKRRILLRIGIFVLIFAVILSSVTFVVKTKNTLPTFSYFYKEPNNSLDVIFLGSSHMLNAVSPLQLYNDYGIASHNCAQVGQPFFFSYEILKETLKYQHPKLVIVDIATILWSIEPAWRINLHRAIDDIPPSLSKYFFINDIYKDINSLLYAKNDVSLFEAYFPMYLYHSGWDKLKKNDFLKKKNLCKGIQLLYSNFKGICPQIIPINNKLSLPSEMHKILNQIIETLNKENISLIFTVIPYDKSYMDIEKAQKYYNEIYWLVKNKNNVNLINYFHCYKEANFDFSTDLANIDHLNFYGAQKITAHIGKYIKENYDIPDRRLDSAYAKWNNDYKLYVQDTFAQELNATKNSEKYLELLTSKKEATDNTCIFIVKTSEKNINSKHFDTLGVNITGNNYIAIIDNGKVVYNRTASDVPLNHKYKIGNLPVKIVSDVKSNASSIKVDGIEQIKNKSGMTLVIYDKLLKKVTGVRSL